MRHVCAGQRPSRDRYRRAPQTWTQTLAATGQGRTSLAIAPSNQNIVYALAASNQPGNYLDGLLGVWRSADSGRDLDDRGCRTPAR